MHLHQRPDNPRRFLLQARDRMVLREVAAYRYLTSDHVHALLFRRVAKRQAQARLRHLFAHGYLDRFFVPVVMMGAGTSERQTARPLYCLARHGAEVVGEDLGLDRTQLPHTPAANAAGYATLTHHLIATDLLVAAKVAASERDDGMVAETRTEGRLRSSVAAARASGLVGRVLVPDAAFTLRTGTRTSSFYIEVVRAGVKGGNAMLTRKLRSYVELNRNGTFKRLYGNEHLRAVLFVTPTTLRAKNLQQFAAALPHGRSLFWFTGYGKEGGAAAVGGVPATKFDPDTVLDLPWQDGNGTLQSLHSAVALPGRA